MTEHNLDPELKLIALNANRPLADKIAAATGVQLAKTSVKQFSDGEIQINLEESIRGDEVFVIQSISDPINKSLMELMIMIDALRRASAKFINVVIPYYGYSRQDRKARSREPITAKLIANLLQMDGATRVIALDLHAAQLQGFFDIPVDHLQAAPLLANYFKACGLTDVVVVSPDHSSVARARQMATLLGGAPIAIIDRRQSTTTGENLSIIGDVAGKKAIVVDDMIDTGHRIISSTEALKRAGATKVYAAGTHAVFSDNATAKLQASAVEQVVVTDSINIPDEKHFAKLAVVSVGELIGKAIQLIHDDQPIDVLFHTVADKNED
ncbi:ribose-phosphate pyrophosphokinase [Loigolactobacillus coryniformis subsp. coryniformis]|uniref:Putative ribose-phosphate pyrophosphokinase n=1 Tax=Loigolactobacillus coryniformis subsp. coryniformis KCTC 3167 = DSM 20001 TaxID=913848 RepID=A0A0R1EZ88_9LACO|nr:ribose-phosphate diphosphokinase [Loigolactobacillus coryniformis]ATO54246.1 ribose-phosphate pyrophosphokinase [Loigolactobacillus coryniformis subsp. coryniformis KCTC 3167 = DSM 20001]KRK14985.1 phosphoribosylpyrophosphate synthetase [Loigolactobacillus coryniformis subsp. coryniformis KCTC 3167 = DSM 20001]OEH91008.1 ribose-phosphate pyrophosphokinase [Loigolactobacillus coryniformis subsp. coryniformis]